MIILDTISINTKHVMNKILFYFNNSKPDSLPSRDNLEILPQTSHNELPDSSK